MKTDEELIECATNALIEIYEMKDEYAKLKNALSKCEIEMAKRYDTINYVLKHFKSKAKRANDEGK